MDKKHILVVEDEENMLHAMEFILEAADHKVTAAKSSQEALKKILAAKDESSPVDLLIADFQMPPLTGLELIDELNRLDIDMPVLVITGYGNKKLVVELRRRGCDEYLDKPFDDEELVKRVTMLLGKKREHKSHSFCNG
jgi:DNA-binding response OmpR family regulator